jgi:sarcosine oxidase subunit beta
MPKTILCRCEDVTEHDVRAAISDGYADVESLKRYLGIGTGTCQAKSCGRALALLVAEVTGTPPGDVRPIVARPPVVPVALKHFTAKVRA